METSVKEIYRRVYDLLDQVTPLQTDCGLLCNKACCQDGDEDLGMYLFPGEEQIIDRNYFTIEPTDFILKNGRNILLAKCDGKCDRRLRPLSCRIFPLTPYLTYSQKLTLELDIRAAGICPLIKSTNSPTLDKGFIHAVHQAVRMLTADPEIFDFVEKLSRLLDEYAQLPDLF